MVPSAIMADVQHNIVEYLRSVFSPYMIIVFGSFAKGAARADSDVDVAIYDDGEYSAYEFFMAAQELAGIIGRDVDLINLKSASTVMKAQIVGYGKVIFCSNDNRRQWFFMRTFREYAQLNEDREPILRKIREGRSIYGE